MPKGREYMTPATRERATDGSSDHAMDKPLDQPKGKYTVNESVPPETHDTEIGETHENPGDYSKRFM